VHAVIDNLSESLITFEVTSLTTNRNREEPLIACDVGLRSNGAPAKTARGPKLKGEIGSRSVNLTSLCSPTAEIFEITVKLTVNFCVSAQNPRFMPEFRKFAVWNSE